MITNGTKLIQYDITHIEGNKYSVKIYERFAPASRSFDCRPEAKIVS